MQIPKHISLMEVYCNGKNKSGRRCGQYLGRVQVEGVNRYMDYHCHQCGHTNQVAIDEFGLVRRDQMPQSKRLRNPAMEVYFS